MNQNLHIYEAFRVSQIAFYNVLSWKENKPMEKEF